MTVLTDPLATAELTAEQIGLLLAAVDRIKDTVDNIVTTMEGTN